MTGCFLGSNECDKYNMKIYVGDTIRYLIIKKNLRHFIFTSGNKFEMICFETIKSFDDIYGPLTYEICPCRNIKTIKTIIDRSDYCIFEDNILKHPTPISQNEEIFFTSNTLEHLLNYAKEKNKLILHI